MNQRTLFWGCFESKWGWVLMGVSEGRIARIEFVGRNLKEPEGERLLKWANGSVIFGLRETWPFFEMVFGDSARSLKDIPVQMEGTAFQIRVWEALREIPAGQTITYGELGVRIGRSGAARAIGSAVGANSIGYVVPCHRVLRSDGGIGGFRWGVALKRQMLRAEGVAL